MDKNFKNDILEEIHKALQEVTDEALTFGIKAILEKEQEIGTYGLEKPNGKDFHISSKQAVKVLMKLLSEDFEKELI